MKTRRVANNRSPHQPADFFFALCYDCQVVVGKMVGALVQRGARFRQRGMGAVSKLIS